MKIEDLVERFVEQTGAEEAAARAAFEALIRALGACMTKDDAHSVAGDLGVPALAERLRDAPHGTVEDFAGFNELLAEAEGVDEGLAIEHAQVAALVLADAMDPDDVTKLRRRLPATIADILEDAPTMRPPPELYPEPHERPGTLASGRPGSTQPLSEARPPEAQSNSVADPNPHGGSKLSSADDIEADALAEAKPGSKTPISESD